MGRVRLLAQWSLIIVAVAVVWYGTMALMLWLMPLHEIGGPH